MKKRIMAILLLIVVLVSCFSIAATATTKKGVKHAHDRWEYSTGIISGNYKSTYNDCTSNWSYCNSAAWEIAKGTNSHATKVTNNQYGTTSGWVYARCGCNAVATVKANWFGKNGTASIWCNL